MRCPHVIHFSWRWLDLQNTVSTIYAQRIISVLKQLNLSTYAIVSRLIYLHLNSDEQRLIAHLLGWCDVVQCNNMQKCKHDLKKFEEVMRNEEKSS